MVAVPRIPASGFAPKYNWTEPTTERAKPKTNALYGVTCPEGNGRLRVRSITESVPRSHHWFSAAAPAAQSAVPTTK